MPSGDSNPSHVRSSSKQMVWRRGNLHPRRRPSYAPAMIIIYLLIPLSIVVAACFLGAFIWAVRTGQYEDTCTPSMRLLLDDRNPRTGPPKESLSHPNSTHER